MARKVTKIMQAQTAVVIGASGLIGSHILKLLLEDKRFDKVRVLVRKPIDVQHSKLEQQVVNFGDVEDFKQKLGRGHSIFCAVGTTQQKVKGNKEAYRKVDYDIPVNAARIGYAAGFTNYLLVSSVGANASAKNFYLQLKGEVEQEICKQRFNSIHIFQPSMLLADRKEFRLGEVIGKVIMKGLSFLFVSSLKKYKAIEAEDVAKAMVEAAASETRGIVRYQYEDIMKLVSAYNHP
jgi:uncharacterized protein YbjT (DUF2867 family)